MHAHPCGVGTRAHSRDCANVAVERVEVVGQIPAPPEAVWAVAGDFCGSWHPAIASIRAERGPGGALVRAFTVHGEERLYREQVIYRSDSDRCLSYLALEGIDGAERYVGRIVISPSETGCSVTWSAEITAASMRAAQIAAGTKLIFESGLAGLNAAVEGGQFHLRGLLVKESMSELTTLTLSGNPTLALTVTPQREGPLVLFLHGIGGARSNWVAQLHAVAPFARAAALDLRGYGDSTLGPAQSTVDDHCDDILRVMQALGADQLILVGLSFGAWIATSFALRHPDKMHSLVLSGGCTGMSEASPQEREAFRHSREIPLNAGQTPADFAPAVVKVLSGPNITPAVQAELLATMSVIPVATYRDAITCFTNPREQFDFSKLNLPVLLMTGQHDRLAPPTEIREVARRITEFAQHPDVRFEQIMDAGHLCNLEQPSAYNKVLVDFIEGRLR